MKSTNRNSFLTISIIVYSTILYIDMEMVNNADSHSTVYGGSRYHKPYIMDFSTDIPRNELSKMSFTK